MAPRTLTDDDTVAVAPAELRLVAHRLRRIVAGFGIIATETAAALLEQADTVEHLADALDAAAAS